MGARTRPAQRLSSRIGGVFAVAVASLVLALAIYGFGFDAARREAAYIRGNIQPIVVATNRMLNALEQMENAEFLYFFPEAESSPTETFDRQAGEFERWLTNASEIISSPETENLSAEVSRRYRALLVIDGRIRELAAAGNRQAAERLNLTESMTQADRLRDAVRELRAFKLRQTERRLEAAESAMAVAETLAIGIGVLGIILGTALWRISWRAVGEPLLALLEGTRQVAQMRFVPVDHPAARQTAELDELQASFNSMIGRIGTTTSDLARAQEELERKVSERTADLSVANQTLAKMVEDLKAVDKLKSDLFAVVSHELLTPINFVTGHGSLLEDGVLGPLNPGQNRAVRGMLDGAERLTRMVRNILEFTQLEKGLSVRIQAVDYADVADSVAASVSAAAEGKQLRFAVDIPGSLPQVLADPDRAGQVLSEILDNSLKFTPEGGSIRVEVRPTDEDVVTTVSDTGPGVPPGTISLLTEPFFQVDLSSTRQHGGLGLGLAIVKHLVDRMGGKLGIESSPGRGSTFRFTLPRADATN